ISEAVRLVLQAGAIGTGGEIFILDMGEPINILQLANELIALHSPPDGPKIEVVFTGALPGEKLREQLGFDDENMLHTANPKVFAGKISPYPSHVVEQALLTIEALCKRDDSEAIRRILAVLVPEASLIPAVASASTNK
ncbi:MAG: polysaccharide biosynthesis protein, partial [Acidobacteria bacterium]|nr:polysaccharide biosynthesis protein [Acidobacteriota bacterium]